MPKSIEIEIGAHLHSHFRQGNVVGALLAKALEGGFEIFGAMPNTDPPLTDVDRVIEYIGEIEDLPVMRNFKNAKVVPFVMITENTTSEMIDGCVAEGVKNAKVYPRYRTTNSGHGVKKYAKIIEILKHCGKRGMMVHFHPEHPSLLFNNRDAEFAFLPLLRMFLEETEEYNTIIVSEHGTDARCISHWKDMATSSRFYVTLTPHHLATDEDKTYGDVRAICKPSFKTGDDCSGLVSLVGEDHQWVMAGADDAPHDITKKHVHEGQCACGAYTAPFLMPLYAHALQEVLDKRRGDEIFRNFTSRNCRRLHGLPAASKTIGLFQAPLRIPYSYRLGPWTVEPFWAGKEINWNFIF